MATWIVSYQHSSLMGHGMAFMGAMLCYVVRLQPISCCI